MQANNEFDLAASKQVASDELMLSMLKDNASLLQDAIAQQDWIPVMQLLQKIQSNNEHGIYQEVGRLTRALHDAIRNFHVDGQFDPATTDCLSDLADAKDRLSYVVESTEKAANKTMDLVDECVPIASDAREELTHLMTDWQRLVDRELSADEFRVLYWRVDQFFKSQDSNYELLQKHFTEILLAQDYQDLTGQVIQRVTSLVREVESSLLNLVTMASQVDKMTGQTKLPESQAMNNEQFEAPKAEGPQIKDDHDVVSNQDDVDDLLSSLGF